VERPARPVHVARLELVKFEPPDVVLAATVSGGTYVRSLGADLAEAVGSCGHLVALHRTRVGPFRLEDPHTLFPEDIVDSKKLAAALAHGAAIADAAAAYQVGSASSLRNGRGPGPAG